MCYRRQKFVSFFNSSLYTTEESDYAPEMKDAVANIFYKGGEDDSLASRITPAINHNAGDLADLPSQVTPELMSKFIAAQVIVGTKVANDYYGIQWGLLITGMFCSIGVIVILFGVNLFLLQHKLDKILEGKNG